MKYILRFHLSAASLLVQTTWFFVQPITAIAFKQELFSSLHILQPKKASASSALSHHPVVHAISPSCVTVKGSSSCNIGVNPVPTLASFDGGYQWLTIEPMTETISGKLTTAPTAVFTAKETKYLSLIPTITTPPNGLPVTATSTQYINFLTAKSGGNIAAGTAFIAGVVIAPALVPLLQPVLDTAAAKTVSNIVADINNALKANKIILSIGDAHLLAEYMKGAVLAGGSVGAIKLGSYYAPSYILTVTQASATPSGSTQPAGTPDGGPSTSGSSSTKASSTVTKSSSSTSDGPIVTAIVDPPYSNWQAIKQVTIVMEGPTPTGDDFAITSSISRPWCIHGASPHGNAVPNEYCQCGPNGASLYPVATSITNPCPWAKAPGPTLTFAQWTLQSADGITCSYPSTMSCATYNRAAQHAGSFPPATSAVTKVTQNPHGKPTPKA